MRRHETGKDGVLLVGGNKMPFSNCSYNIEWETTSSSYNDELRQYTSYTNVHSNGSFEFDGANRLTRRKLMNVQGNPHTPRIVVRGYGDGTAVFRGVKFNSYGREAPADDKTTSSVEWEADVVKWRG